MTTADQHLAHTADRHLANNPEGQLVELLFTWIDEDKPTWLPLSAQRKLWPTEVRFEWLLARPDVRARIVSTLAGITDGAARRLDPDVQIALIDAVVDNEDVSLAQWAAAFSPHELAGHAPPGAVHPHIRERFPWEAPPDDDSRNFLYAWIEALLSSGDGGPRSREPILTPLGVRSAIDPEAWQSSVPLDLRAAVDSARIAAEHLGKPFDAAQELNLVTLQALVEHLPHRALHPVLEAAERSLRHDLEGFEEALRSDEVDELSLEEVTHHDELDDDELPVMDVTYTDPHTEEAPRP